MNDNTLPCATEGDDFSSTVWPGTFYYDFLSMLRRNIHRRGDPLTLVSVYVIKTDVEFEDNSYGALPRMDSLCEGTSE
jgi:hypothetical protein